MFSASAKAQLGSTVQLFNFEKLFTSPSSSAFKAGSLDLLCELKRQIDLIIPRGELEIVLRHPLPPPRAQSNQRKTYPVAL